LKNLRMTIAALVVALLSAVGLSAPAQADISQYRSPNYCVNYSGVTTCLYVDFARQADGDGVRLEGFGVITTNGCGQLESSGGRYSEVRPVWVSPAGYADSNYSFGTEPCNFYKDLENDGSDTGHMFFVFGAKARVNLGRDKYVRISVQVGPAGGATLLGRTVTDA
jgi:hypothetical protein